MKHGAQPRDDIKHPPAKPILWTVVNETTTLGRVRAKTWFEAREKAQLKYKQNINVLPMDANDKTR